MANDKSKNIQKSRRGGARPGAGRKKGKLDPHNQAVLEAKKHFIQRVAKNTDKLFNAQFGKAVGETFLMRKVIETNDDGKVLRVYHEVVEDPKTIIKFLDGDMDGQLDDDPDSWYYMTTKSADNSAISDMLNRGLGKATEHIEADVTSDGERISGISENQLTQLIRARSERRDT